MNQLSNLQNNLFYSGIGGMLLFLLFCAPGLSFAQETDTTRQMLELKRKQRSLDFPQNTERSMSGGLMTKMGTYNAPTEGQYYHPPFMGQKYLDMAVEAYYKEMEENFGGWFWNFLRSVSPYIRVQFAPLEPPKMQFPDRNNPLWESYTDDSKRQ